MIQLLRGLGVNYMLVKRLIFTSRSGIHFVRHALNINCLLKAWSSCLLAVAARYPDHFTSTDEKVHAARRRIVSNAYSMTSILQSEKYLDGCTDVFIQQLGAMADHADSFGLFKWCRMYAYDAIGELYFSKMLGFLEVGEDVLGYIDAIDALIPVMALSAVMPTYVRSLLMFTSVLFPRVRKALAALGSLTKAADGVVQERQRQDNQSWSIQSRRSDVIGKVLDIYYHEGAKVDFQLIDVKLEAYGAL